MYVIGIDGGGTKTRLAVCAPDGTLLRRETLGAFNLSAIGEDGFRRRTEEILALCGDMRGCGAICVGGAGVSGAAAGEILRAELAAHGFAGKLLLCGDHEIALAGAMQTPGCVLIAGTGSVCYGKNAAGEAFRCGGGGFRLCGLFMYPRIGVLQFLHIVHGICDCAAHARGCVLASRRLISDYCRLFQQFFVGLCHIFVLFIF